MTIDISQFYQVFFDEAEELLAEMERLLLDYRSGALGRISLETPATRAAAQAPIARLMASRRNSGMRSRERVG